MDITNSIAILAKKIESLEALICANSKKELMTLEDVVAYTGYRCSSLLTLACHREILYISHAVENWSSSAVKSTNGYFATANARTKN